MILDNSGIITLVAILAAAALIAIVAFVIHRVMHPKLKSDNEKPSDEQIMQEELDRVLQPVDDEETAKEISEYKDEE
jgi:hypothetical protein